MNEFAILTNRRRAVIALAHSLVFLALATWQAVGSTPARGVLGGARTSGGTWVLCGIYIIVSAILLWLFAISRGRMEKLYFALCTVSATSGFMRTVIGDQGFHSGRYIRVLMLASAVIVGTMIARWHSQVIKGEAEA